MRPPRPSRPQLAVALLVLVLGGLAVLLAALGRWWFALAVLALLAVGVVIVLRHRRWLRLHLNRLATRVVRRVDRARVRALGGRASRLAGESGATSLPVLEHWATTLLGSAARRDRFLQRAKRTRSHSARDLLAHDATRGRYRFDDLSRALEYWRATGLRTAPSGSGGLVPASTLLLARLLYSQRAAESDLLDALTLYDLLAAGTGEAALADSDRSHYADLCMDQGRFEDARRVLDARPARTPAGVSAHSFLRFNTLNPHLGASGADEASWLAGVNTTLERGGFQPLRLDEGDGTPFQRLRCDTATAVTDGPLVSVLMPIYEPDAATDKAIESILHQSWRNLELIIVDDGSPREDDLGAPTGYAEQLRGWAARDERITLVLNDENHGAYWVRNQAYDLARGEFVTVADKDDWHHPEQIAWQVRDLQDEPTRIANMVSWVRVGPLLRFLVRWGPDRVVHPSFASIMFRREPVKQRLGYWDTVRKGADNEFRYRLEQAYRFRLRPTEPTPLIFSLMGETNLTSNDLGLGYEHEDRGAYTQAYRQWHRELETSGAPGYVDRAPVDRPFPAPGSNLPERVRGAHYDVVHVVELDSPAARAEAVRTDVAAALEDGQRVGIVPAENFLDPERPQLQLDPGLTELVRSGAVTRLALATEATADRLVIRPPTLFQVCRDSPARLVPAEVVVVADEEPSSGGEHRYEVSTVAGRVRTVFGAEPTWSATTETIHARLQPLVPRSLLDVGTRHRLAPVAASADHGPGVPDQLGAPDQAAASRGQNPLNRPTPTPRIAP